MPSPITQNVAVTAAKLAPTQQPAVVAREASSSASTQNVVQKLAATESSRATTGSRLREQVAPRKPPQVEGQFPSQRYRREAPGSEDQNSAGNEGNDNSEGSLRAVA